MDDDPSLIVRAVPVFFLFIAIEAAVDRRRGRGVYNLPDALANVGTGLFEQTLTAVSKVGSIGLYLWVYEKFRWAELSASQPWTWGLAFVGADILYYWWHRLSHEVNFMWAAHVVHHQSEDYNLTVALRQSWFTGLTSAPFYFPLALVGVPPVVFLAMKSAMTLYQFWIHTQFIGRMGWVEAIFNTPSHHRVHHAINPAYVDKNYGGTFIVWDRIFGTFAEEREPVVYGTIKRFGSYDAIWANFAYWAEIVRLARRSKAIRDKIWSWFAPPAWRPSELGGTIQWDQISPERLRRSDSKFEKAKLPGILAGFAGIFVLSAIFIRRTDWFGIFGTCLVVVLIGFGLRQVASQAR